MTPLPRDTDNAPIAAASSAGTEGVATHCPYCALQCAQTLTQTSGLDGGNDGGNGVTVEGRDFPTNRGGLCQKGWTSAEVLATADRLTTPLVRTADGDLVPTSWDEALDLVAEPAPPDPRRGRC